MSAKELTTKQQELFDRSMAWSQHPQLAIEVMRADALLDGSDPTKKIQQNMLDWMVNDDPRCIPEYINDRDIVDGTAWMHQQLLVSRLSYEAQLPELHEDLRQKVIAILDLAQHADIDSLEAYRRLRNQWFTEIHDYVSNKYHPQAL